MRFLKLSYFNQALVGKQVWRMMVNPNLLVAQIFKARYYKNGDIMEAQLGSNPSFVWRSLCWGRELLKEGMGWMIANGRDIDAGRRNWFANWALASSSSCRSRGR